MKYLSLILNIPWTFAGLLAGLISIPKKVSTSKDPYAIILSIKSFWWFSWQKGMKNARAMAIGNVVLLGPITMENDLEHELIHVRQFGREPLIHPFLYMYQNWKYGYRNNRYEREAYEGAGNDYVFGGSKMALLFDDKIIVTHRDDKSEIPYPNMWDLPGGGREGSENPAECGIREIKEELGIEIDPVMIVWSKRYESKQDSGFSSYFLVAEITQKHIDSIVFGDEGQGWELIPIKDFLERDDVVPFFKERLWDYLLTRNGKTA